MSELELKTNDDYNGQLSDIIKVTRACEESGLDVRNMINALRRPDKKALLQEIKADLYRKTETQKAIEEKLAQEERAKDFGLDDKTGLSEIR